MAAQEVGGKGPGYTDFGLVQDSPVACSLPGIPVREG